MNHRDAKFYISVIAAALLLAVCSTVLSMSGRTGPLRNAAMTFTTPFRSAATGFGDKILAVKDYWSGMAALRNENADLRKQIEDLQRQLEDDGRQTLERENERLRKLLGMKETADSLSGYSFLSARVISYESADHVSVLTVNRGTADGVKLNQTVITADGLLGRVSDVGRNWAKISTVLDLNNRTGVYIERTGTLGILGGGVGTGTADPVLKERGFCLLSYLDLPQTSVPVVIPEEKTDNESESDTDTDIETGSEEASATDLASGTDIDASGTDLPEPEPVPGPYDEYLKVGDRVVTSGVGYVFPAGIVVGTVSEIRVNPYDRTVEAVICPAVDLSIAARTEKLTQVVILIPSAIANNNGDLVGDLVNGADVGNVGNGGRP